MTTLRVVLVSVLALGAVVIGGSPALAAPPSNDTVAGATVISALPFGETLDTTEATSDADEAALATECGLRAADAGVWYSWTNPSATSAANIGIDVTGSDYSAQVIELVGSPGSLTVRSCGSDSASFLAFAGETVFFAVVDTQRDGGGNGGLLSIRALDPVPTVDVTVDSVGSFNPDVGTATVSGTVTCNGLHNDLTVSLSQQVDGSQVTGGFFDENLVLCDLTTRPWTVQISPRTGMFAGGPATADVRWVVCGFVSTGCTSADISQTVRLRG
jgi:hypothetical protein